MKIMKILTEVSNSIGMFNGKLQGSCWRAGTNLIVTAWHVVHEHICKLVTLDWRVHLACCEYKSSKFQY
jgi:hypothetical protein